jgi:hypothetical protein
MNSVDNLKSTQLRKVFRIYKFRHLQSFDIFGVRQGLCFEFKILGQFWKLEIFTVALGPPVSDLGKLFTVPTGTGPAPTHSAAGHHTTTMLTPVWCLCAGGRRPTWAPALSPCDSGQEQTPTTFPLLLMHASSPLCSTSLPPHAVSTHHLQPPPGSHCVIQSSNDLCHILLVV